MLCPFCKEEIQEGALKCKHCGSMLSSQGNISTASTPVAGGKAVYTDYSQIPWFRKNWFAILCAFILTPALFLILITGDVYYVRKGQLKKYGKGAKIFLIIWSSLSILAVLKAIFVG